MVNKDITEAIPAPIGNPVNSQIYSPTGIAYDIAIGGQPFFLGTGDDTPYRRLTAQYRKQQIDQSREPGEQTLTGWWLRSQSSFHLGQGIKFYEPTQDENLRFQYTESKGCNVWEKGQVTLLRDIDTTHYTTGTYHANGRPFQYSRSIEWDDSGTKVQGILLLDGYDLDKIDVDGNLTHFHDYIGAGANPVYAMCDDGVYAYWITNDQTSGKLQMAKKLLSDDSGVAETVMFTHPSIVVTNAVMEYTKDRIVACINNKIYEIPTNATTLPSVTYTHSDNDVVFTSVTSGGSAIYVAAYSGIQSYIYKFTLGTSGTMPVLTSAISAAEMPTGEKIFNIAFYLGYMAIGTNLGVRIAAISETDGSISYGPLLFKTDQPVYDFDFYDKYIWATTNVDGNPGVTRINLGQEMGTLIFAYSWDLYDPATFGFNTTSCAFAGDTDRLVFTTANNGTEDGTIYIESATRLVASGSLRTGFVRYNTLENKIFKYITPRFDTSHGGITISSIDKGDSSYSIGVFGQGSSVGDVGISYPPGAQQYLGFEFTFTRDVDDNTLGPIFTGYQLKVLPAIPRQRLLQFPCEMYDSESDKYGNKAGYEGSAFDRLKTIEAIESNGDTVIVTDFRTDETFTGIIEEIEFQNRTPTDKRYSGYGGICMITIRTIS